MNIFKFSVGSMNGDDCCELHVAGDSKAEAKAIHKKFAEKFSEHGLNPNVRSLGSIEASGDQLRSTLSDDEQVMVTKLYKRHGPNYGPDDPE